MSSIPKKYENASVYKWTCEDVKEWLLSFGYEQCVEAVDYLQLDGDLLLLMSNNNVSNMVSDRSLLYSKRFIRDLERLKEGANYDGCDPTGVAKFLNKNLGQQYVAYTYNMIAAGITTDNFGLLTDTTLMRECQVLNAVHRSNILKVMRDLASLKADCEQLDGPTSRVARSARDGVLARIFTYLNK